MLDTRMKSFHRSVLSMFQALFAITAAISVSSEAHAVCRHVAGGSGFEHVWDDGQKWTYVLEMTGDRWLRAGFGWHASGAFECKTCRTWGLYNFIEGANVPPSTSATRAARGGESFGYPKTSLGSADLVVVATRDDLKVGSFSGYAVRYRPETWRLPKLSPYQSFLVVSLTDGCAHLDATLASEQVSTDWSDVDSLIAALSIERMPGAIFPQRRQSSAPAPEPDYGLRPGGWKMRP